MSRVFLSYARDDVHAAEQLAKFISDAGHEVWWDRHLQGGSRFTAEIDRALREAEAIVVLWSDASLESVWVQDEAAEGRDSGRLVPVSLGTSKPPLGFRQFHTISLVSEDGEGRARAMDNVLRAIAGTCGADLKQEEQKPAETAKSRTKISVCVLPFVNMSGEPEQEYFSDGITEDIITDLSKVSSLSVIARNTAFTLKGQSLDLLEVARNLRVSHILEGSVRKAANRVRITAQLIDGTEGDHIWGDRYDRDLIDIFEIQDEISKAIVSVLKVKLLPQEKEALEERGTTNVAAYNLYLMARQQWISGGFSDPRRHERIIRLCREATLLDPEYGPAWALLALTQALLRFWHGKEVDALPAAERAIAINPKLPEGYCVKARYLEEEGRIEEAEQLMRLALQLAPQSWEANRELAVFLYRHGRISEGIPFFEKAASLMESDTSSAAMLTSSYKVVDDPDKLREAALMCVKRAERAIALDPRSGVELAWGSGALVDLGEHERARDWIRRAVLVDPDNDSMRYNLACALAADLHDSDAAIQILEPWFDRLPTNTQIRHLEADPDLSTIRADPRFRRMLAQAKARLGVTAKTSA
ncbi:MAG: TIR domain-containing protein [Sphingomicrobium sp.]